jgi:hypothetical protein
LDAIIRRYGDTNVDAKLYCQILDHERLRYGCSDTPREICGIIEGYYPRHDDRKFVPTNPGKKCVRSHDNRDPPSKFAERAVSRSVAIGVVDRLKAIEVHHQNGHSMRRTGDAETLFKPFFKEATIR